MLAAAQSDTMSAEGAAAAASSCYTRTTILANVWIGHKPIGLTRLPEELAARLSPANQAATVQLSEVSAVNAAVPEEDADTVSLEEASVGYPFFHPAISMQRLPAPLSRAAQAHSLVLVPPERLELRVGGAAPG